MKVFAILVMTVLGVAMFAGVGAAAWSMSDMLTDERQIIAATTNCSKEGIRVSFFKASGRVNAPCDNRELSRLMLLSGMDDQARYKECSMPDALRDFATVYNCLNFDAIGPEKVLADVRAKMRRCGGLPKSWHIWRKNKYRECMGRLA